MPTKVILDTTYLLPIFGISIDLRNAEQMLLRVFHEYEVLINSLSILESKWKALKIYESSPRILEAFSDGLLALTSQSSVKIISFHEPEIDSLASQLYVLHPDYFDCSITATALLRTERLVTEDTMIWRLVESFQYTPDVIKARAELKTKLLVQTLHELLESTTHL